MKLAKFAILSMIVSGSLAAQDIKIVGTVTKTAKVPVTKNKAATKNITNAATNIIKQIKLLNVQLSAKAKQNLAMRAKNALSHTQQFALSATAASGDSVQLGMNDVPVLDQGMHGTCVTFATTAAIDAALGKGDYVSQVCQLELGSYLEKTGYSMSGWEGSLGRIVLNQMDVFGIISKEQQTSQGCAGVTEYPTRGSEPNVQMTPDEYHQMSENVGEQVAWSPVLDIFDAISDRVDTNKVVADVKRILKANDRLTFGVLLLDFDLGFMGAVGSHNATFDSWVLTPEIARDVYLRPNFGGHEMVITGYDDNAVATDDKGVEHRGLFTLRNSWGDSVGDHGNFYMSYDYFKLLVIEVQRIRNLGASEE
ncbi:C1 family peptidase [Legionella hackeliae]|uniref:Cysteine protease, papain C1 family n=1 Tax=Legionella hackeliae TaxID=449 RepID=A0A0A8UYI1_LEGHA|nr:C1 family peptidase [Legionella hackeliae]KTD12741.1 cysteine protease [Legionella hackeliae]CEK12162.1 Cysteine protease, papain C1 family [Legionella hackeliae]STX48949.1 cysteine protease, papain C1 family [Legionella hackeliae]